MASRNLVEALESCDACYIKRQLNTEIPPRRMKSETVKDTELQKAV